MAIIGVDESKKYFRGCYEEASKSAEKLDVVEMGTYSGHSLCQLMRLFRQENIPINHFWGCDSFAGLPPEKEGVPVNNDWWVGQYNSIELYRDRYCKEGEAGQYGQNEGINFLAQQWPDDDRSDSEKVVSILTNNLRQCGDNFTLIPGFYCDSLTAELAAKMNPMVYVHVDCDIYVSTYQALDFLFKYNLVVPGTFFRHDDWLGTEFEKGGESLAHKHITEKYKAEWNDIQEGTFILKGYNGN